MTLGGVGGLILAAGVGRRIGMAKLRLMSGSESFLHRCWCALVDGGVETIVCVVSPQESGWARVDVPEARIQVNEIPSEDMITSVRRGVSVLTQCAGVILLPVDHPHIKASTVRCLVDAGVSGRDAVVKPTFHGQSGHPIFLPQSLFPAVLAAQDHETLRGIIAAPHVKVVRVDVVDPAILMNINTRDDLSEPSHGENMP
jgi:molybdenum cofactor cytidylyltransferase